MDRVGNLLVSLLYRILRRLHSKFHKIQRSQKILISLHHTIFYLASKR